jgi:nucleolar protein 56
MNIGMKAYIVNSLIGVFALDERGELVDENLFQGDAKTIAQKILETKLTQDEKELLERLKKRGYSEFVSSKSIEPYKFEQGNIGEKNFRQKFRFITKQLKISDTELNQLLTKIGIELTKINIKRVTKKDSIVIQTISAIDEIDKSLNIFAERLREWYSLHFPEMNRAIERHEKYANIVSEHGLRNNIEEKDLQDLIKTSMGMELSETDGKILKEYATAICELYKLRERLEKYVDYVMKEIAPNTRGIAGSVIGARLIALAGGLDNIAKKPSSTIQLLGAEKALFRYLRGRGRSPKYGLLFTHPMVQNAPQDKRGKIARVLASKLNIAVKLDYYGKEGESKDLKEDLEKRIKSIMVGKDARR